MSYLVGICGGSGSGKTTLAKLLMERLIQEGKTAALISFDDYYKPTPGMTTEQRVHYNFDVPEALDANLLVRDLNLLKANKSAEIPIYDFATQDRLEKTRHVEPADIILIEGILLFADEEVRQSLDLALYVDVPADVRLTRRMVRDIAERGHTPQSAADLYLNTVREAHAKYVEPYKETSDLVVNNVFDEVMLEVLVAALKSH